MGKEFEIEKLKGSSNYHTWCFAIQNVLQLKGFEKCITDPVTETNADKLRGCKATLSLSVDTPLFVHITKCETALEIWNTLKNLFDDKGLSRKVTLLRNLISTRLEDCDGMQPYVDKIVDSSNKLNGIGFDISDDWKTAILLAGLTETYNPFIMGIEASNTKISSDTIISKLLDSQSGTEKGEACFGKKKFNKKKNSTKKKCCCNKHMADKCDQKKADKTEKSGTAKSASFCALISECKQNSWYVDSGASSHMTPNGSLLSNKQDSQIKEIVAANNEKMQVNSVGKALLKLNENEIEVKNVLHVPNLSVNLLSVSKIVENGNTVTFNKKYGCTIRNFKNEIVANCQPENGVYRFGENSAACMLSKKNDSAFLWHRRLGHINYQSLLKMRNGAVFGINFDDNDSEIKNCGTCPRGKQARLPFKPSESRSTKMLELIHSDLCGPMENQSIGHAKYILTFIDDFSRKVFVYFLKSKAEVLDTFIRFKVFVENQMEAKIKVFRTDNGKEYLSAQFDKFCQVNGMQHQLTCPYSPQQNGVAERMNRTLVEKARCLLFDADLPICYWAEAINMAAYLKNISVCASHGKTPNELYYGKKVDVSDLKLFGCPVMVHITKQKRKKWDPKSTKMIFVGYDADSKGYRCIDRKTRKLTISRDVIFRESTSTSSINLDDIQSTDEEQVRDSTINDAPKTPTNISTNTPMNFSSDTESEFGTSSGARDETLVGSPNNDNDPDYIPEERIPDTPLPPRSTRSKSRINNPSFQLNSHFAFFSDPSTVSEAIKSNDSEA